MPESEVGPASTAPAPPLAESPRSGDFDGLRALLVGPEAAQVAALEARLDDLDVRRRDIGEVLPEVLLEHALDPDLARALAPGVERAITTSVRQNPGPLADALFPVMGPAIRKAIASSLAAMVESLSRTLEQSVSWRSILWRLEAVRTGKSFAEVLLLHTLVYRVEQVFLIDRASGLLLHHVHEGAGEVRDVDMVSGMLTAIRDFVQDSFRETSTGGGLEALRVGSLSVWIEQGPRASVAAVLRGAAPREYRARLQSAVETIHLEFGDALEHFSGDTDPFKESGPVLDACLHTEYRRESARPRWRVWAVTAVVLTGLALWAGISLRERMRWNRYLDALKAEPGIVVVSSGRRSGRWVVTGLRDPLSRDPEALLGPSNLAGSAVDARWESYHTSHPALAVIRAREVLQPPTGVTLALKDGILSAAGAAPTAWLAEARKLAPLIPGVSRFDASGSLQATTSETIAQMERVTLLFAKGQAQLAPGQDTALRQLTASAAELQALAAAADRRFTIDVVGHTDTDGAKEANLPLSRARAEVVRLGLTAVGADRLDVVGSGVGSDEPVVLSDREDDKRLNRRVSVHVRPSEPGR